MKARQDEVEHLKNILVGLKESLVSLNDIKVDRNQLQAQIAESERQRDALQDRIMATAEKVRVDT